jgi:hypothetical protein
MTDGKDGSDTEEPEGKDGPGLGHACHGTLGPRATVGQSSPPRASHLTLWFTYEVPSGDVSQQGVTSLISYCQLLIGGKDAILNPKHFLYFF